MRNTILFLAVPSLLAAQMPGVPVLQNAWATPGLVGAVNFGGGSNGSVWGGAASWAPGGGRFQLSGGAGMQSRSASGSRGVYGVRAAMPFGDIMEGRLGIGAFAGVGGGGGRRNGDEEGDTTFARTSVPVGAAIGFRQAMGSRGFSAYASPSYQWVSASAGSNGLIRVALGVDVALARNIGVTAGIEMGQTASEGKAGPRGTLYGVGASYALGSR